MWELGEPFRAIAIYRETVQGLPLL